MIVIVVILSGYLVYNDMFPVAKPIQYPSIEDITSISISTDDNKENKIYGTDFTKIIIYISNSKPTRTMSVNDFPSVRPYYKIEVLTDERMFNYYIYKENNNVYIELPYEGIYIIDSQIVNIISNWI
jgi:hypothetical protein